MDLVEQPINYEVRHVKSQQPVIRNDDAEFCKRVADEHSNATPEMPQQFEVVSVQRIYVTDESPNVAKPTVMDWPREGQASDGWKTS